MYCNRTFWVGALRKTGCAEDDGARGLCCLRRGEGDTTIEAYMRFRFVRLLSASVFWTSLFPAFAVGDTEHGKYLDWHPNAPDLTSSSSLFQKWGEAGLTKFLETGVGPSGHAANPPMPAHKMKAADARDIAAYLKALK